MKAENGARLRVVECALLDHQRRPAALTRRRPLLGRLENELDGARQIVPHAGQDLSDPHQHGDVRVMAAGVHHPNVLTVVGGAHLGGEREIHFFGDGERVHVGAQRHDWPRLAPAQYPDHTGMRDAGAHLDAE